MSAVNGHMGFQDTVLMIPSGMGCVKRFTRVISRMLQSFIPVRRAGEA